MNSFSSTPKLQIQQIKIVNKKTNEIQILKEENKEEQEE